VRRVAANEALFGVLSSGGRIAVALVLDVAICCGGLWGTLAELVHRLGPPWTQAALGIQRNGQSHHSVNSSPLPSDAGCASRVIDMLHCDKND
jgi:hypothetical protein